jgi:hypothetical protein
MAHIGAFMGIKPASIVNNIAGNRENRGKPAARLAGQNAKVVHKATGFVDSYYFYICYTVPARRP